MPHKFDPARIDRLDSPERLSRLPLEEIFSALPLQPSQTVADLGCGTGIFSLPLAQRLPQGKVYCLDIAEVMLERVRRKVQESRITNIEVKQCSETDFGLEPGSLDGVFLAFVLHEQEDRAAFLQTVRPLLKAGGWVGVVEWQKKEMSEGPPLPERIDPAEARQLASQAGLKAVVDKSLGDRYYLMVLTQ